MINAPNAPFKFRLTTLLVFYLFLIKFVDLGNAPVVLWHGMGDSCCNKETTYGFLKELIESSIGDVYIHSIKIGNNILDDTINGFLMDSNEKIRMACLKISNDPMLKNGYNAIGFSQGAQFLRGVAQRCPDPPMLNLISIGGQHQGVYGIPFCPLSGFFCSGLTRFVSYATSFNLIQRNFVQASYWHDPFDTNYRDNNFIAELNQEKTYNENYKNNLLKLKALVLVKFELDEMVTPIESQWFGFFRENQAIQTYKMEEFHGYFNDTLGLKTLDSQGKIQRLSVKGRHLQMKPEWFISNIIIPFLQDRNI